MIPSVWPVNYAHEIPLPPPRKSDFFFIIRLFLAWVEVVPGETLLGPTWKGKRNRRRAKRCFHQGEWFFRAPTMFFFPCARSRTIPRKHSPAVHHYFLCLKKIMSRQECFLPRENHAPKGRNIWRMIVFSWSLFHYSLFLKGIKGRGEIAFQEN